MPAPAPNQKNELSVVVMVKNEADTIEECLASASFADELIVADTGSADETRELAARAGADVIELKWEGFGPTKARAMAAATSSWVLSLDADERVTPALAEEIQSVISGNDQVDGFYIPRRTFFLGHEMKYSGWGRDKVLRLVRRGNYTVSSDPVHEFIRVKGRTGTLQNPLDHHTTPTFAGYLTKIDLYSTLAAERIATNHRKWTGVAAGLVHGFAACAKKLVVQQGWRDGYFGVLLAVSTGYEKFLRYMKAGLIRRNQGNVFDDTTIHEIDRDQ